MQKQKKGVFLLIVCSVVFTFQGISQTNDSIMVYGTYNKTPLLKVLDDFETKYDMPLKYDSTLISRYSYDYLYLGMLRQRAFDEIFEEISDLAYYIDDLGVYCIVLKRH